MWFVSSVILLALVLGVIVYMYHLGYTDAYKELKEEYTCNCEDCYFFRFTEDAVNRYYESGVGDHEHYDPTKGLDKYMHMTDRTVEYYHDEVNKYVS